MISVLSGDKRQLYIKNYLSENNYDVCIKNNFDFNDASIIVCSTPFTRDGKNINCDFYSSFPVDTFINLLKPGQIVFAGSIPLEIINEGKEKGIIFIDVLNDPDVVWKNALLTAEGLISRIIDNTDFSIMDSNVLIMGFGRCGTICALKLKLLGARIHIYDHTLWHMSQADSFGYSTLKYCNFAEQLKKYDIIINTVPEAILTDFHYSLIKKSCILFEIAGRPFGFSKDLAEENNLSLITCPGIPGVSSPKSAGELIAKSIISYLERTGINGS